MQLDGVWVQSCGQLALLSALSAQLLGSGLASPRVNAQWAHPRCGAVGFAFQEGARLPGRLGGKMLRAEWPPEQLASSVTLPLNLLPLQLFPPHDPWLAFLWLRFFPFHAVPQPSLGAVCRQQ